MTLTNFVTVTHLREQDSRFVAIMQAADRGIASIYRDEIALCVISMIYTCGNHSEEFDDWSVAGAREQLKARALHMPKAWLLAMARVARREVKWIVQWEAETHYQNHCTHVEWDAVQSLIASEGIGIAEATKRIAKNPPPELQS